MSEEVSLVDKQENWHPWIYDRSGASVAAHSAPYYGPGTPGCHTLTGHIVLWLLATHEEGPPCWYLKKKISPSDFSWAAKVESHRYNKPNTFIWQKGRLSPKRGHLPHQENGFDKNKKPWSWTSPSYRWERNSLSDARVHGKWKSMYGGATRSPISHVAAPFASQRSSRSRLSLWKGEVCSESSWA